MKKRLIEAEFDDFIDSAPNADARTAFFCGAAAMLAVLCDQIGPGDGDPKRVTEADVDAFKALYAEVSEFAEEVRRPVS